MGPVDNRLGGFLVKHPGELIARGSGSDTARRASLNAIARRRSPIRTPFTEPKLVITHPSRHPAADLEHLGGVRCTRRHARERDGNMERPGVMIREIGEPGGPSNGIGRH